MRARAVLLVGGAVALGGCGGGTETVTRVSTVAVPGPTVTVAPAQVTNERNKGTEDTALARDAERLVLKRYSDQQRFSGAVFGGYEVNRRKVCVERVTKDQIQLEPAQQRITHVDVSFPDRKLGRPKDGPC